MITELDVYQQEAIKTCKPMADANLYFALKIQEEASESASLITKHHFHGKPFDKEDLKKELGDVMWYVAAMANHYNFPLSEIATTNIDKLRKRHGDSYNQEHYL